MIKKLEDFINSYNEKPIVWGVDDCTAWAGKWAEIATGNRIQLPSYGNREGAHKIIDEAGGLVELVSQYLGFPQTFGDPDMGDIAVVETGNHGLVTVLMLKNNVAAWRAEKGLRIFRVRSQHIKAYWTIDEQ